MLKLLVQGVGLSHIRCLLRMDLRPQGFIYSGIDFVDVVFFSTTVALTVDDDFAGFHGTSGVVPQTLDPLRCGLWVLRGFVAGVRHLSSYVSYEERDRLACVARRIPMHPCRFQNTLASPSEREISCSTRYESASTRGFVFSGV